MRKRIIYLMLLFLSAYIAIIYNSTGGILLVGVELLCPLFLFLILLTHRFGLSVEFSDGEAVRTGEDGAAVSMNIKNNSIFPVKQVKLSLFLCNESLEEKRKLTFYRAVGARQTLCTELPTDGLSCGIWRVTSKRVAIYDLIGLFCLKKRGPKGRELVVLPKLLETTVYVSQNKIQGPEEAMHYHPHKTGNDMSYIQDLREYRPGDRLSGIHWKVTAKREELTVKVPGLPMGCVLIFFLDHKALSETFLTAVYSLAYALNSQKYGFYLAWNPNLGDKKGKTVSADMEPVCLTVMSEEDLYHAMTRLMRLRIQPAGEELYAGVWGADLPQDKLLLDQELKLLQNGRLAAALGNGDLGDRLMELELII